MSAHLVFLRVPLQPKLLYMLNEWPGNQLAYCGTASGCTRALALLDCLLWCWLGAWTEAHCLQEWVHISGGCPLRQRLGTDIEWSPYLPRPANSSRRTVTCVAVRQEAQVRKPLHVDCIHCLPVLHSTAWRLLEQSRQCLAVADSCRPPGPQHYCKEGTPRVSQIEYILFVTWSSRLPATPQHSIPAGGLASESPVQALSGASLQVTCVRGVQCRRSLCRSSLVHGIRTLCLCRHPSDNNCRPHRL